MAPLLVLVGVVVAAGIGAVILLSGGGSSGGGGLRAIASTGAVVELPKAASQEVEERWSVDLDDRWSVGAHASGSHVFAVLVDYDREETELVAFNRSDGEELWAEELDVAYPDYAFFEEVAGTLVVGAASGEGAGEGTVAAFDMASGEERWSEDAGGFGDLEVVDSNHVAVTLWNEQLELMILDVGSGDEVEQFEGDRLSVFESAVYVLEDDELERFDLNGTSRWSIDVGDGGGSVSAGASVVAVTIDDEVLTFSASDGEELWDDRFSEYVGARVVGDHVLVSDDDDLIAVDRSGDEVWTARGRGWISQVLRAGGRTLLLTFGDGEVMLTDMADGEEIGSTDIGEDSYEWGATSSGVIVREGRELRSHRHEDMEERWSARVPSGGEITVVDEGVVLLDGEDGELVYLG